MKKLLLLASFALALTASCKKTPAPVAPETPTPAQQLITRLDTLRQQGLMYGHQDDPFYGINWEYEEGRSDTRDLVGEYPAVMGFDLGGIEMGDQKNLDSVPFDLIRREIIAQHYRGGIITISWHPRNPRTGGNAWDVTDTTVVRNILPGGEQHEKFSNWTNSVADFLRTLVDEQGNAIPFILRPWHEYNGSWFWWGQKLCSDEEYKGLWAMFQDSINAKLYNNVVWSCSPNLQGGWTEEQFLQRWPGDDRIDLVGEDCYQWGSEEDFIAGTTVDVKFLSDYANRHGKLFAITECGMKNSPVADWWSRVFLPCIEGSQACYFLPWRNYKEEHFGATKGAATADDFKQLAEADAILFVNDIVK